MTKIVLGIGTSHSGALDELDVSWSEYIPIRRSPAGTGIGLGFMAWT